MNKILEFKDRDRRTGKIKTVGNLEIKNKTQNYAELYFYGDIVSSSWMKWEKEDKCPQDVADFLNDLDGIKNINIYINSGGGSVFAGLAIYNQLKRNPAYKTVCIDGLAASIASVIALSGDKVIIPSTAQYMIHKPWTFAVGNSLDFRKLADDLDKIETSIVNVYKENLKDDVDIEDIIKMMEEETWMNGEEASKYFNIEVSDDVEAVACASQYFDYYKNVPNSFLNRPTNNNVPNDFAKEKLKLQIDLI